MRLTLSIHPSIHLYIYPYVRHNSQALDAAGKSAIEPCTFSEDGSRGAPGIRDPKKGARELG